MSQKKRLSDDDVIESAVKLLEEFQRNINRAVRERGWNGSEPNALNVIDVGLFGLLCQAKILTGKAKPHD